MRNHQRDMMVLGSFSLMNKAATAHDGAGKLFTNKLILKRPLKLEERLVKLQIKSYYFKPNPGDAGKPLQCRSYI